MKRLYIVLGIISITLINPISAMDAAQWNRMSAKERKEYTYNNPSNDQEAKDALNHFVYDFNRIIQWDKIFKIFDNNSEFCDMFKNSYRTNSSKATFLILAVQADNMNIARTLLEKYRVNPNECNANTARPLSFAKSEAMKQLLIKHGAKASESGSRYAVQY